MSDAPLTGKIALITGASRGIGAAVAQRFAREGAHVILVARSKEDLEKVDDAIRAEGGTATLVPLDLGKPENIETLAASIAQRFGKLDILIGNAATLGTLTPLTHDSPENWRRIMELNVNANWELLRCFDAPLRASETGRAIFVTSGITERAAPYWGAYAASKAALETMVTTYAAEVAKTNLRVNLLDPGRVRTQMRANAYPGEDPETLPTPETTTDVFLDLASPTCTLHGVKWYIR